MTASLRDLRFTIHDVLDFTGHYGSLGLAEAPDRALLDAIIDEAARFCEGELAPINASGDKGCRFADGEVTTPPGFRAAYQSYIEGGWAGLSGDANYGGQGLPDSVSLILEELMSAANMAWTMYPGLSRGVIEALEHHGTDEQKARFLPRMLTGEWTGTMCLTEPHAGSDVGLARTRAELVEAGEPGLGPVYAITGTKIFISAGEHDLADNIVHLVLAREPDSPDGTRGISMFIVPKFDLDGSRNGVVCGNIEEKMGIHGNATCVLHFESARGYLVGEVNQGMRNMFTMMNAARLVVGLQGVCQAQVALRRSSDYAQERLQMRALSGPRAPDKPADPIVVHPDVRRLLLTQRAIADGGRMLVYFAGQVADRAAHLQGAEAEEAQVLLDFLTPIVKGVLTELGLESVNHAIQVYGGHGFIRETGIEQYARDARITTIYEGTTAIQGLDLLGRKILQNQGAGLMAFLKVSDELASQLERDEDLKPLGESLADHGAQWGELAMNVGGRAMENLEELGAAAVDFLLYSGYLTLAFCWGRIALTASQGLAAAPGDEYLESKLAVARFYFARMLPRAHAHKSAVEAGAGTLTDPGDSLFTAW